MGRRDRAKLGLYEVLAVTSEKSPKQPPRSMGSKKVGVCSLSLLNVARCLLFCFFVCLFVALLQIAANPILEH